jgi:hypothetical protein
LHPSCGENGGSTSAKDTVIRTPTLRTSTDFCDAVIRLSAILLFAWSRPSGLLAADLSIGDAGRGQPTPVRHLVGRFRP